MNRYNPHIHHRKSIRLKGYDYAQAGLYFTTNTSSTMKNRINAFRNTLSTILQNGRMINFINNEQRHPHIPKSERQHQNRCRLQDETVCLSQDQMVTLFGKATLTRAGKISHKMVLKKSGEEYEKFNDQQKAI